MSTVRRRENPFAAGLRSGSVTEILRADQARANLVFHGADADLNSSGRFVPMHPPDGCAPIGTRCRYFRPRARVERTACAFIGQAKTDRSHIHRAARFVADHDSDAARSSRAYTIADTFAFHYSQLQDLERVGRDSQCQGAADNGAQRFYSLG